MHLVVLGERLRLNENLTILDKKCRFSISMSDTIQACNYPRNLLISTNKGINLSKLRRSSISVENLI